MALKSYTEVWENRTSNFEGHVVCESPIFSQLKTASFPNKSQLEEKQPCEHKSWNQDYMDYFYHKDDRNKLDLRTIQIPDWLPHNEFSQNRDFWTGLWYQDPNSRKIHVGEEPTISKRSGNKNNVAQGDKTPIILMNMSWQKKLGSLDGFERKCAINLIRSGTRSQSKAAKKQQLKDWLDNKPKDTNDPIADKWKPNNWNKQPFSQKQWGFICESDRWGGVHLK